MGGSSLITADQLEEKEKKKKKKKDEKTNKQQDFGFKLESKKIRYYY